MPEKSRKGGKVMTHSILRRRRTWNNESTGKDSPARNSPQFRSVDHSPSDRSRTGSSGSGQLQTPTSTPTREQRRLRERTKSSSSLRSGRQLPVTPHTNRRLELALNKFDLAMPFHLDMISNHRINITELQSSLREFEADDLRRGVEADAKVEELRAEVEAASKSVRQLGSLLFEMEVLKSYLEVEADLAFFERRVDPAKLQAYQSIQALHEICPTSHCYSGLSSGGSQRSSSLTPCPKTPESPLDFPNTRRHSDSETQSISSLPYSSRESLISTHKQDCESSRAREGRREESPVRGKDDLHSRGIDEAPARGKEEPARISYHSPSSPRTLSKVGAPTFEFGPSVNPQQPLEILYEDPKEDVVSILSEEEKLLQENEKNQQLNESKGDQGKVNLYSEDKVGLYSEEIWGGLEEEIRDINILIKQITNIVPGGDDCKRVYENARNTCSERGQGYSSTSTIYPMAGALLGTCLGGPVGFLAGVKIGGLAAIGGSIFGYSTGSLIKENVERQEYISDFYSKHCDRNQLSNEKRAVSLPDILDDANPRDIIASRRIRQRGEGVGAGGGRSNSGKSVQSLL